MTFDNFLKAACPPLDLEWRKYRRRAARHRVEARLRELGLDGFAGYLDRLQCDPAEAAGLADRMRVTVSRFFRERQLWDSLFQKVLPTLLRERSPTDPLRLWSVGCCGGEEPYTLALLWGECFALRPVEILATDIDTASLERARTAVYDVSSLREVPAVLRRRYFHRQDHLWRLDAAIAGQVRFAAHNLMTDPLPVGLDLILCRYLAFTYYRGERRLLAARRLWQALRPGGALMIGRKEDLGPSRALFTPWPEAAGVFRKPLYAPAPPSLDLRLGHDTG
ncbi:MAG TPA: protein-glutamate O-methyltransferase CheR [Desulfuromonadales bacterium]